MILTLFIVALVFALVVFGVLYVLLDRANELKSKDCGNCDMYDKSLHTCWLKTEFRYPGDKGCDHFYRKDEEEYEDPDKA